MIYISCPPSKRKKKSKELLLPLRHIPLDFLKTHLI